MDDLISRQAAIDALNDEFTITGKMNAVIVQDYIRRVNNRLHDLPSAQPEIIYCKECKYGEQDEVRRWYCRNFGCQVGNDDGSGFCADAERKADE